MVIKAKSNSTYIFDVGGTYLRSAEWISGQGPTQILSSASPGFIQYPGESSCELKNRLLFAIEKRLPRPGNYNLVSSISLGAAINHLSGEVYGAAPLWGPQQLNVKLTDELHNLRPDVHWLVMNDVTAMALHFSQQDICRSVSKAMLITVSSGIACRVFQTTPFHISFDLAGLQGEIGHLPAVGTLPPLLCDCGETGHIAAYSSGRGIRRVYELLYKQTFNQQLRSDDFENYFKQGLDRQDVFCKKVLTLAMQPLADFITTVLVIDPSIELIALSGGVIDSLGEYVKHAILERLYDKGPYITSKKHQKELTSRLFICPPNTASGLWGAGVATEHLKESWFANYIPHKEPSDV
ncbi:ROK family protein [Klebsiella michiganensis]|uniref:ROK family protein n=1 Tax=Klebsiella michiganensis TaxID=1134687 RepID=UPI0032DA34BB